MNIADYITLGIVVIALVFSLRAIFAHKKKGGCISCIGCPMAANCAKAEKKAKQDIR